MVRFPLLCPVFGKKQQTPQTTTKHTKTHTNKNTKPAQPRVGAGGKAPNCSPGTSSGLSCGFVFCFGFSPARPRIRYPLPAAARSVLVAMGTRAGASLRKCDAVSRPMGMARPGARRFPTGTPSLARSRGAPRTTSRPWPSHNPARTPGLFLFRHLAAPVSRGVPPGPGYHPPPPGPIRARRPPLPASPGP